MWHPVYDIILPLRAPPWTRGRFFWITFMKCSNYVQGMLEMMCRLPCCFGDWVPFLEDKVLKLATEETRVESLVDLIFFSDRELYWWWRRRVSTGDFRFMVRFKKGVQWNTLWIRTWDGSSKRTNMESISSMIQKGATKNWKQFVVLDEKWYHLGVHVVKQHFWKTNRLSPLQ